MAKQKKTGKGRLDKYYKLAKEQGYRARSAFKLIQLNKKYAFLESARCCIDLCAAPGGWLQVASKYMPVNSIIVGVDLVPIKPVPRVTTYAADITKANCRNLIRSSLKDWQADVVLHDGAPNVGTAWVQDAYSQSELVLMALKLAVEFLIKGGTFVTKVFRSTDYNNLVWVFNQLFGKVEATKPPSSRNVSAEIFVVCRDFLAPKFIDPKFLDPKHVFKEVSLLPSNALDKGGSANNVHENVFQPSKKRRMRDGYAEGNYTLFKTAKAEDFVKSDDAIGLLGTVNKIVFASEEEKGWLSLEVTTEDISANCSDLKVLGKGDFKALLRWRTAIREEIGLESKSKPTEEFTETVEIVEHVDEEEQIQDELERLNAEASSRRKRERRRTNELKQRAIQRMQLQMTAPMDIGLEQEDATLRGGAPAEDVFDLTGAERGMTSSGRRGARPLGEEMEDETDEDDPEPKRQLNKHGDEDSDASDVDREKGVSRLEAELDGLYDAYMERMTERDAKFKVKEARRKDAEREAWGGIRQESDQEGESEDEDAESQGGWERMQETKAMDDQDASSDDASETDADGLAAARGTKRPHDDEGPPSKRQKGLVTTLAALDPKPTLSKAAQVWFDQDLFKDITEVEDEDDMDEDDITSDNEEDVVESADQVAEASEDSNGEVDDFEIVPREPDEDDGDGWDVENPDEDETKRNHIQKYGLLSAEAMTLASQLVNREKTRTQLINDGFNRQTFNDKDGLPPWFLDDEQKHYKANLPITKEAVAALRARQRALDARPIKKIAEAKGRKKIRAVRRLEQAMKKAQGVSDGTDMTEKEKAQQIEKLMRKGFSAGKKKTDIQVVVAKGVHRGLKGRPKGVKGRYVMVDRRGKKELRAKKRRDKEQKTKGKAK